MLEPQPAEFSSTNVESIMAETVLPTIQALDLGAFFVSVEETKARLDALRSGGQAASGLEECDATACDAGQIEICVDEQPQSFDFTMDFQQCAFHGAPATDGTISGACNQTSCTVTFGVTQLGNSLTGTVALDLSGKSCIGGTFTDFRTVNAGSDVTMDGSLEWCAGTPGPTGSVQVWAVTAAHGAFRFDMTFDGTEIADVVGYDLGSGDLLGTCEVNLATDTAVCVEA